MQGVRAGMWAIDRNGARGWAIGGASRATRRPVHAAAVAVEHSAHSFRVRERRASLRRPFRFHRAAYCGEGRRHIRAGSLRDLNPPLERREKGLGAALDDVQRRRGLATMVHRWTIVAHARGTRITFARSRHSLLPWIPPAPIVERPTLMGDGAIAAPAHPASEN